MGPRDAVTLAGGRGVVSFISRVPRKLTKRRRPISQRLFFQRDIRFSRRTLSVQKAEELPSNTG